MERNLKSPTHWLLQGVMFGAIGLLNTVIDLGLYFALTRWTGLEPAFAKGISYTAGLLNSFHWNRTWTFRSKASLPATFFPFVSINLSGLAINAGVMQISLNGFHFPEIVALGLATIGTLAWNFTTSKFLVFRK